jgi:hypothetical protein
LLVAAVGQALQALVLVGLGVATAVAGLTSDSNDLLNAELVGALALGGGFALLGVARGLLGARSWARSPALVWQLIAIPIGFTTSDDLPGVAYPLLASAAGVLVGLFAPSTAVAMGVPMDGAMETGESGNAGGEPGERTPG